MGTILLVYAMFLMLLLYPKVCSELALQGLLIWYQKMIPTLLPFMIVSGIMVNCKMTSLMSTLLKPFIQPVFRVRLNVIYCIISGFLCGFPMGAKITADMYEANLLTKREAEYILAFCNLIGPNYYLAYVLPLLNLKSILPYLAAMYGIPLLYGILIRYTAFKDISLSESANKINFSAGSGISDLIEKKNTVTAAIRNNGGIYACLENVLGNASASIIRLGGLMIIFNVFNILPSLLPRSAGKFAAPLVEISSGLASLGDAAPLYSLLAVQFGGLCCLAQTQSVIRKTDLSMSEYIIHKGVQFVLTVLFYIGWNWFFPDSFLE